MKFIIKNLLIMMFLLLSGLSYSQINTFYTEPFTNNSLNGWTVANVTANGLYPNTWFSSCAEVGRTAGLCGERTCAANTGSLHIGIGTNTYNFYKSTYNFPCTTGDCGAVYFSGASDGNAVTDQRVESPLISTSTAKCTIYLSFNYILGGDSTVDNMTVEFSGDNGATWTEIGAPPKTDTCSSTPEEGIWAKYQVALPDSLTGGLPYTTVKIGFRWVNNDNGTGSSKLSVAIDSVMIYARFSSPYSSSNFVTVSPSSTQCTGSVFVLSPTIIDANYFYVWNSTKIQDTIHVTYNTPGTYYNYSLTAGNAHCGYTTYAPPIYVVSCTIPIAKFSPGDATICQGQCINFSNESLGQGPLQYTWTINDGSTTTYTGLNPPQECFNSITGSPFSVKLVVKDVHGNLDSITHTVTVNICNGPVANFSASPPNQVCKGGTVTFTDKSIHAATWAWIFNGGTPDTSSLSAPPPITYADTGSFNALLVITDGKGDTSSKSLQILVDSCPPVVANFTATTSICAGDCIQFTNESTGNPISYAWAFNGGTPPTSTQSSPQYICYTQPGIYDVTLKVYGGANGTDSSILTKPGYITVFSLPTASAMIDSMNIDTISIVEGLSATLTASGGINYSWYPTTYITGGADTSANITVTPFDTTVYTVTVADANGCTAQQKVYVDVIPENTVFVPTLFTPNHDGINDYFKVYIAGLVSKFQLLVFDRWGAEIFSANDVNTAWDGNLNGRQCEVGVYVWYYKITFANGLQTTGKGSTTLMR